MSIDHSHEQTRLCIATIVTDSFVPGAIVTLHSFLKHNRWFRGDIVIIHHELSKEYCEALSHLYDRVRFLNVGQELQSRIDTVTASLPELTHKQQNFYSLELFGLRNYDKVLYCDSDILFRRSIRDFISLPHSFIACGDGPHYYGHTWKLSVIGQSNQSQIEERMLYNTFNAGLFLVDRTFLTNEHYTQLLNLVDSRFFQLNRLGMTDQMILNLYFAEQKHLISATFNYLMAHRTAIYQHEGLSFVDAYVLHFNGQYKPWLAHEVLHHSQNDPAFIKACTFWFNAYAEGLEKLYMQSQIKTELLLTKGMAK